MQFQFHCLCVLGMTAATGGSAASIAAWAATSDIPEYLETALGLYCKMVDDDE